MPRGSCWVQRVCTARAWVWPRVVRFASAQTMLSEPLRRE